MAETGDQGGVRETALIDSLVRELAPVRPVRPLVLLLACLSVEAVLIGAAAYLFGVRADLAEHLSDPRYVAVLAVVAGAAAWCASIAIRMAIPGRDVGSRSSATLLATPIVLAVAVVVFHPWGGTWPGWSALVSGCLSCVAVTAASAVVPWLVTLSILSRLAPLNALRVGMFAGVSAFLVGGLVTELHCPDGGSYHLAFAHYLPVSVLAALTCVFAATALRARMRTSPGGA